jgi:predicted RNA-binding Zn-ribbon protein involved in translation (DUF1610 family)
MVKYACGLTTTELEELRRHHCPICGQTLNIMRCGGVKEDGCTSAQRRKRRSEALWEFRLARVNPRQSRVKK